MDHLELMDAISRDPTMGYVALSTSCLQAKVRNCIDQMMQEPNPKLYFGFGDKIKISKSLEKESVIPSTGLPFKQPWLLLGSGNESVYAIFSPSLMENYGEAGLNKYPIKVGRTNRTLEQRLQELQTGSHLDLRVGLQLLTNDSRSLELKLHKYLSAMKIPSRSSSSEWFYSNLQEIRDLFQNNLAC